MDYLKNEQHYIDLYDLHTVETCLDYYWTLRKGMEKRRNEIKDMTPAKFDQDVHRCCSYAINILKAERYRHKSKSISEWMDRDRKLQDIEENTQPPNGIYCKECGSPTKVGMKLMHDSHTDNPRMTFMFECIKCKKRQIRYEDGSEWIYKLPQCPKCNSPLKEDIKHLKEHVLETKSSCTQCSYTKTDIDDSTAFWKEQKEKEAKGKKLLTEYRDEFCLNDKNGPKYLASIDGIISFAKEMKEREKKEKDPICQKAKQLKKLKAGELKELLEKKMTQSQYSDLQFGKPEMGKYIIIDFSVNDMKNNRNEHESINLLRKIMRSTLEKSNWRLMTDGPSYRLGILTGRLKAYEKEEDLLELVR